MKYLILITALLFAGCSSEPKGDELYLALHPGDQMSFISEKTVNGYYFHLDINHGCNEVQIHISKAEHTNPYARWHEDTIGYRGCIVQIGKDYYIQIISDKMNPPAMKLSLKDGKIYLEQVGFLKLSGYD